VLQLPELPAAKQVLAGRIATLCCGAVIILLALGYASLSGVSLFDLMLKIVAFFFMPQMVPLLLFLFLRKTAPWAAVSSIIFGFMPSLANFIFQFGWSYQVQGFSVLASATLGYILAIPFWRGSAPDYRQRVTDFYARMHQPVDFASEVGAGSDVQQMRLIGRFGTVLAAALLLLLLLPNSLGGRLSISGVSLFVFAISGLLLWRAARRARAPQIHHPRSAPSHPGM
jgi:Na+/proline symporter